MLCWSTTAHVPEKGQKIPLGNTLPLPLSACGASQQLLCGSGGTAPGAVPPLPHNRTMSELRRGEEFPNGIESQGGSHNTAIDYVKKDVL